MSRLSELAKASGVAMPEPWEAKVDRMRHASPMSEIIPRSERSHGKSIDVRGSDKLRRLQQWHDRQRWEQRPKTVDAVLEDSVMRETMRIVDKQGE
jgi:hypothetical protein